MHDDKPDEDSHELQRPQKSKEILGDQIHISCMIIVMVQMDLPMMETV